MMKKQILIIIHQMAMAGLIIPNIMHIGLLTKQSILFRCIQTTVIKLTLIKLQ